VGENKIKCQIKSFALWRNLYHAEISSLPFLKANFEKAYWQLKPTTCDNKKELAVARLCSIAPHYIDRREMSKIA